MPLILPELDDRRFADLMAEALANIPALAPQWTDYNPSDPGITLLELFAWLSDVLMYRINRVTDDHTRAFLALLNGPDWRPSVGSDGGGDLVADTRATVLAIRTCDRAVTPDDFVALSLAADPRVARAACVPRRDLTGDVAADAPAHVSVVIVPTGAGAPPPDLLKAVAAYLEPRRLLTTRLHVVASCAVPVAVALTLTLKADAVVAQVRTAVIAALQAFLDPIAGGPAGAGWPFGRDIFASEIYSLVGQVPGVDYADPSGLTDELTTPVANRRLADAAGSFIGLRLQPDELPLAQLDPMALTLNLPVHP